MGAIHPYQERRWVLKKYFRSGIWNVLAWCTITKGPMDKWRPQLDSPHQNGLEIFFTKNTNGSCGLLHRRWRSGGGIFHPQKLEMFSLVAQEPSVLWYDGCYRRIQRIKLVKTNYVRCSDCRLIMLYKVVKKLWANFYLRHLGPFCFYFKNYKRYGQTEAAAGFCTSKRLRNTPSRNSNASWGLLHRWWSKFGRNFSLWNF